MTEQEPEKLYLAQLRGKSRMTQEEVAAKLGISKFTWRNWEIGKSAPDLWELQKIKKLFNVALDDIKILPKTTV
ncbi:helix-turn-helix domain-containing protein [Lactococcus lactis]|uniref:helix-turn-helix transcriptional regulator n=1 Tax=Lactococcus lactis TaxID=1358 RepID=UPI002938EF85|nr:helix-turn-helix transcriptional regulator [Lactococcus lactis]WOF40675.1 helix-turn-helix domain-containing protein [Lactococcus lactis]